MSPKDRKHDEEGTDYRNLWMLAIIVIATILALRFGPRLMP